MTGPESASASDRSQTPRIAMAAFVGTALEWYDFFIYGTAAALVFNKVFFPALSPVAGTLAAFAAFGVGFVARPLGGLVLGNLGDRLGRREILLLTLLLMGVATIGIGLLPGYQTIGIWAPLLLVLARLVQGFAAGAEYAGAVVISVENAPARRRGLFGSWACLGVAFGVLASTGVFAVFDRLPHADFLAWGWRVPFLLSVILIAFGVLARLRLAESPAFEDLRRNQRLERLPVLKALRSHPRSVLVVIGSRLAENSFGYAYPVFLVAYATKYAGLNSGTVLTGVVIASAVELVTIPLFASLSDRVGRRAVYMAGAAFSAVWIFPVFWLLDSGSTGLVWLAFVVGQGVAVPAMFAPQAAYYAELFGTAVRYSGFAFARELGSIFAGGLTPFAATALVAAYSGQWVPAAAYMAAMGLLTVIALAIGPETYRTDIAGDLASGVAQRSYRVVDPAAGQAAEMS